MMGYETKELPSAPLNDRAVLGVNWRAVPLNVGVKVTVAVERVGACAGMVPV